MKQSPWRLTLVAVLAVAALLASTAAAGTRGLGISGRVGTSAFPQVQQAGSTYYVSVTVTTTTKAVKHLCVDFDDDDNSWLIQVAGGLREYKKDVFCYGRLRPHATKQVVAKLVAAKAGQHKLGVGIGNADIFPVTNAAVLDADSLYWSADFVIV